MMILTDECNTDSIPSLWFARIMFLLTSVVFELFVRFL